MLCQYVTFFKKKLHLIKPAKSSRLNINSDEQKHPIAKATYPCSTVTPLLAQLLPSVGLYHCASDAKVTPPFLSQSLSSYALVRHCLRCFLDPV